MSAIFSRLSCVPLLVGLRSHRARNFRIGTWRQRRQSEPVLLPTRGDHPYPDRAFLAGYFAQNWDALRQLRQKDAPFEKFNVPRLDYVLPVILGVLTSLALFFWLSDLDPPSLSAACS